ncbi:sialate O-acetylesterase [Saccharicrinis sp. 156]|uniref:sialate O-acetylesterase n=1 Tax=Saccharicrinis sp. 156 TaxID=3417574 RepID=UPI003D352F69
MKRLIKNTLLCLVFFLGAQTLFAQTKLPAILSDNMCLQQSAEVKIWGWDNPGQTVTVKPSWAKAVKTETSEEGKWLVKITTPKAGKTGTIKVTGSSQETINNILFGEVWLCSGQSNMERALGFRAGQKPIVGFYEEAQKANYNKIRMFNVPKVPSQTPVEDIEGEWVECTTETALKFSAVGFFYGKELHENLNTPVGLIQSAWGGTPVEPWTPEEFYTEKTLDLINKFEKSAEADSAYYFQAVKYYKEGIINIYPKYPVSLSYHRRKHVHKAVLYNGMISPLINYCIKGAIWYQGESNVPNWKDYKTHFPNMINSWREKWGIGDFPFYFVQIAPRAYDDKYGQPQIVEAQCEALKLKNTGVAATQDIGAVYDIHPPQKREVGRRLSLVALNQTYGKTDVVYQGPALSSYKAEGEKMVLEFETPGSELYSSGFAIGGIYSFYVAGENKIFYPARAKQEGNKIILNSAKVQRPVAVRYNWANNANATLFNLQGLPALPFRTDDWDDVFYGE